MKAVNQSLDHILNFGYDTLLVTVASDPTPA